MSDAEDHGNDYYDFPMEPIPWWTIRVAQRLAAMNQDGDPCEFEIDLVSEHVSEWIDESYAYLGLGSPIVYRHGHDEDSGRFSWAFDVREDDDEDETGPEYTGYVHETGHIEGLY